MNLAHPIHPKSPFAKNLKREFAEGIKQGKNEGFAKGIEQGIEQGIEKGREKLSLQIIQQMLAQKMSWDMITQLTQYDLEGYERLKAKYQDSFASR